MERDPDAEVIIITGHGDLNLAVECLRRNASNFLTKPVSDELLSFAMKRSLERLALKHKVKQYTRNLEDLVRQAESRLQQMYHFRENLIENSPDAIVCIRKGGNIIIFNTAAERLLGYTKDEVIGELNIRALYPPGVARQVMKDLRSDGFGGPGVLQKQELSLVDRHGNEIPVFISASLLYEEGEEAGSVGIFTDLRERKAMEQKLLQTEKLSSLGKIAAGIAHEINQPLTGVLTFASLLGRRLQDDEEAGRDVQIIVRETHRIRNIVKGILDFARETPARKTSMPIEQVLDQTLELIVHQQRFFGVELTKDYGADTPRVSVDGGQLQQVFMNIVFNALDAMNGQGVLTIRTRSRNGLVEVEIADNGPGMPQDIMSKIFDPFFTTKDSSSGVGMGLGLAISYGIVQNHQGEIMVTSQEGRGTTFTIQLPVESP
jgi:PAS domain S-box-containing protein